MKKGEWEERPDSWHCLNVCGTIVQVDTEVRKEIEAWLKTLEWPKDKFAFLIVGTILGEEVTIMADGINQIYDTTPELRFKQRELGQLMNDEKLQQGFPDD